jgi:hypothetical protein
MASDRPSPTYDRVVERRRAVALARHFREAEGLSIAQIADRLGPLSLGIGPSDPHVFAAALTSTPA